MKVYMQNFDAVMLVLNCQILVCFTVLKLVSEIKDGR